MKRLMSLLRQPRSLFTHMVALLIGAMLVAKLGSWTASLDDKAATVRRTHVEEMLPRIANTSRIMGILPRELRVDTLAGIRARETRYSVDDQPILSPDLVLSDPQAIAARDRLMDLLDLPRSAVLFKMWNKSENAEPGWFHNPWAAIEPVEMGMKFSVRLPDGQWLNAVNRRMIQPTVWSSTSTWTLLTSILMVALASFYISRRLSGPLRDLADRADRLGRGESAPALETERGPEEVRRAAHAFNAMGARIRRFVDDRTRILAAISHDLRTPITNLRLRVELLDEGETKARMLETLDELRSTVEATLSFTRDELGEEAVRADLSTLVESVCDDFADTGHPVSFSAADRLPLICRTGSMRRAIRNLIENALAYGGSARVSMRNDGTEAMIIVADDGPGIPEGDLERVFEPFVRLESSRNRRTGGVGLGLSIARSVVHGHGGDIRLLNRPGGGLNAVITLPILSGPHHDGIVYRRAA
ncbi:MAG: ATP-binding protein [Niveispirillum sp.]|uniref:ATP-binding protein n=1 Tax=Niveispirillum sp. TaxID=1917217 RepID=UPI003BA4E739